LVRLILAHLISTDFKFFLLESNTIGVDQRTSMSIYISNK
jgi:hypothetical protein